MKRKLAILLSVVLALGATPVSAFGAEGCRHHEAHTADCGYSEGTAGTPCTHAHDESCYTETLLCTSEEEGHEHTADCYETKLECTHEHDVDCGYSEGEEGSPCTYVCGICEVQALIDALPEADEITEDMAEEVGDLLMEIDAEKALLSDEEAAELDSTRYRAATTALMELNEDTWTEEEPTPAADAETEAEAECQYSKDGGNTWIKSNDLVQTLWDCSYDFQSPDTNVEIQLLKDVELCGTQGMSIGKDGQILTINGNGHTIKRGEGTTQFFSVDYLETKAIVVFKNITLDGGAVWSSDDPVERTNSGIGYTANYHLLNVKNGAELILDEGTILQNNDIGDSSKAYGAAVTIYDGTVTMKNGAIIRDNTAYTGGAISVLSGKFIMEGGEISGNYAHQGGGAVYTQADFTMEGGEISNNASGNNGGGVCIGGGTFTMENGDISGNKSTVGGGGVSILGGTLNMNGGSVEENSITGNLGGGVLVHGGSMSVSGAPVVTNNLSEGKTSNVYLPAGKTITIADALESGANIGVTLASGETVAAKNNANDTDYSSYFTSDQGHKTEKDANGDVQLVAQKLPVSINGVNFTSNALTMDCGGGTATLDVGTTPYTLTLENATIDSEENGIYADGVGLNIVLVGENKITTKNGYAIFADDIYYKEADVTIEGNGSLEVNTTYDAKVQSNTYAAIYVCGNLTIHDAKVSASAESDDSHTGKIYAVKAEKGICINGADVTVSADSPNETAVSYGLNTNYAMEITEAKVTATAKNEGISAGENMSIKDSTIDATVSNSNPKALIYAIFCADRESIITITNSKVDAICDGEHAGGIDAKYITIKKSNVKAICENTDLGGICVDSYGKIVITNANVLAIGGEKGSGFMENPNQNGGYSGMPTLEGVYTTVSRSKDGADCKGYKEEDKNIYDYRWVQTVEITPEKTPAIGFDYASGMLTGFGEGAYTIDGQEVTPDANGNVPVDGFTGKTVSIVKKGNSTTTVDSELQKLEIPARPAAPEGVSGGKGKISGVNSDMEYRRAGADAWTPVPADQESLTGLSKGSYEVRFVGTDQNFASEAVTVTVTKKGGSSSSGGSSGGGSSAKDEPTYPPTIEENEGGTASVSTKHPEKGDKVTVTPEAEKGYVAEKVIVTDQNGNEIKVKAQEDGTFTFIQPEGKVNIEVIYGEEQTEEKLAEQPEQPVFSDVSEKDWFYDAVQTVLEKGLMSGAGGDAFLPQQNATRGMIAAILYRMSGESYPDEANIFPDVKEGAYYNPAVAWGTHHSVLRGYEDGLFRPDRTITREELALLIYNFAKYKGLDVSNIEGMGIYEFTDFEEISDWSMIAVRYCINAGLLSGRDDGSFDPHGLATRAEVASVIQRFLEK